MGCNCSSNRQDDEYYFQKLTENLNLFSISDEEYLESISNWVDDYKRIYKNRRKVNSSIQLNKILEDNKEYSDDDESQESKETGKKTVCFNEIYIDILTNNHENNVNNISNIENDGKDKESNEESQEKANGQVGKDVKSKIEKRNIKHIRYTIEHISNLKSIIEENDYENQNRNRKNNQKQAEIQNSLMVYLINNIFQKYLVSSEENIQILTNNTENLSIPIGNSFSNKEKEIRLNFISSIRNHLEVNIDYQIEFIIIIVLLTKYNSNESIINSFGCLIKLLKNVIPYRIEAGHGLIKYKFFMKGLVLLLKTFTSLAIPYAFSMYQALNTNTNPTISNGLLDNFNEVYSEDVVKYYVSSRFETKMMNFSIVYFQKAVLPQISSVPSIVKSISECNEEYKYYKRRRINGKGDRKVKE